MDNKKVGFTGLSFPFRLNNRGGIAMSSTSVTAPDHINESIAQIILTRLKERPMEMSVGSDCERAVFMPNDPATHAILRYNIVDALTRLEPRITVTEDSIAVAEYENVIYVQINYVVNEYGTTYSQVLSVGKVG
mgnify:CR=1 FL=1